MICSQCGAAIPDRSKFCPKCGEQQAHRAAEPDEPAPKPEELSQQWAAAGPAPEGPAPEAESAALPEGPTPEEKPDAADQPAPEWEDPPAQEEAWEGLDEYLEEPEEAWEEPDPYRNEPILPQVGRREQTRGKLASVFFVVGAVALVAGAVLALVLLLSRSRTPGQADSTAVTGQSADSETATSPVSTEETIYAPGEPDANVDCAGDYTVTLWVPQQEREQFEQLIRQFNQENTEGITVYPTLVGVSPSEAAAKLLSGPESGPDLLCLDADRLSELVSKELLSPLPASSTGLVRAGNDSRSLQTAAVLSRLWAYPLSCSGPVLYYDRSVISESAAGSLEAILQACSEQDRYFSFDLSAGQTLSCFFLASGIECRSDWTVDETGAFVGVEDDLESEAGMLALRGLRKLLRSAQYQGAAFGVNSLASGTAAIISDSSRAGAVREILGDNFGVAPLPSFGVDGTARHLGSYLSGELLAVAEHAWYEPAIRAAMHKLAAYLAGAAAQTQRHGETGLCPTAKQAQDAVRAEDPVADALLTQREYSVRRGPVPAGWAKAAQQLLTDTARIASDEEEAEALPAALRRYTDRVYALVMNEQTKTAYTAMGTLNESYWDKDFPMYEIRPGYCVTEILYLKEGEEFKVRRDGSWTYNYGTDGRNGQNCLVQAEGWYRIWFDRNTECIGLEERPAPAEQEN